MCLKTQNLLGVCQNIKYYQISPRGFVCLIHDHKIADLIPSEQNTSLHFIPVHSTSKNPVMDQCPIQGAIFVLQKWKIGSMRLYDSESMIILSTLFIDINEEHHHLKLSLNQHAKHSVVCVKAGQVKIEPVTVLI